MKVNHNSPGHNQVTDSAANSTVEMRLTPLPDGTNRMTDLKIGEPNRRYWEYDERGAMVWQAYPEVVTVPDGVSVIGHLRSPILGEIVIPPCVREIDELAFGAEFYTGDTYEWYALHTVHFSQGIVRIGRRAFYNCRNLDGVRLPKGLVDIEEEAFCLCLSLSRITIPESVEHVGPRAFRKCSSLSKVIFRDGIRRLGAYVFENDERLSKVVLPQTLERIGRGCFSGCASLTEIDLPESLTELGGGAFENCSGLSSLRFKKDLVNAEEMHKESPLSNCGALTELYLDDGVTRADWIPSAPALLEIKISPNHPKFTTLGGALYSKDKKTLLRVPTGKTGEYSVPRGVVAIAPNAFRGCAGITEVTLPSTLLTIGEGAFADCASLRSMDLPGRVTEVGARAFLGCTALTSLYISGSVRHVGDGALEGCSALGKITISPENKAYRQEGGRLISVKN